MSDLILDALLRGDLSILAVHASVTEVYSTYSRCSTDRLAWSGRISLLKHVTDSSRLPVFQGPLAQPRLPMETISSPPLTPFTRTLLPSPSAQWTRRSRSCAYAATRWSPGAALPPTRHPMASMAAVAAMMVETEAGTGHARRAPGWTAPAVKGRSLGQAGAEAGLPFPRPGLRPRRARREGVPLASIAWDRPTPSRRQDDAGSWPTDQRQFSAEFPARAGSARRACRARRASPCGPRSLAFTF